MIKFTNPTDFASSLQFEDKSHDDDGRAYL